VPSPPPVLVAVASDAFPATSAKGGPTSTHKTRLR
jgi:hypothetical protein